MPDHPKSKPSQIEAPTSVIFKRWALILVTGALGLGILSILFGGESALGYAGYILMALSLIMMGLLLAFMLMFQTEEEKAYQRALGSPPVQKTAMMWLAPIFLVSLGVILLSGLFETDWLRPGQLVIILMIVILGTAFVDGKFYIRKGFTISKYFVVSGKIARIILLLLIAFLVFLLIRSFNF